MSLSSYSELQTAIGSWLNRSDLTSVAPDFITLAENRIGRDPRLRETSTRTISVGQDDYQLPDDFRSVISLYHDGSSYYGPIEIVSPDAVGEAKAYYGATGVPHVAAVIGEDPALLRMGPAPNTTYSLKLVYERELDPLSATNTSNWLLAAAPNIYLFSSLLEAELYLQEDARAAVWYERYEEAVRQYYMDRVRREYSGHMVARPRTSIGGDV